MRSRKRLLVAFGMVLVVGVGLWVERRPLLRRVLGSQSTAPPVGPLPTSREASVDFDFEGQPGSDGVPAAWQSRVIVGKLNVQSVFEPELGNEHALRFTCTRSHFILYNGPKWYDPNRLPILSWKWRATKLPTGGDVRTHGAFYYSSSNHNDAGMQVLVGFEGDRVLSYVWDTTAPVGTTVDEWSPVATVKTIVVDSGEAHLNSWQRLAVNIVEDYKRLYGGVPGKVMGVSVQTNSNHTGSVATGEFAAVHALTKAPVAADVRR